MLSLLKAGTICTSVWQEHESNSLFSVCIWMGALISKLCLHWASMYQLVVQRVLWHWTWPENSLLNIVSSQHEPVCVKRTLLQLEQGQSGNMLVIVVSCHRASMKPLYFLLISSLCHLVLVWIRLHFQPPPGPCDVLPAAPGSQRVSLMTRLIPLMHAACVQAPCSLDALRSEQFACRGLKTDRCCSALETRDRMWLWLNTRRLVVW